MAVVSRVTTVVLNAAGLGTRTFQATAAVQDTAAGSSVVVTITQATTGTAPPDVPDTFTLLYRIDNLSTTVKTVTLTAGSASQTNTFFFTLNGNSGGGDRVHTIRMRLEAIKTTGGPTQTYNVNSDDTTGQSLPALWTVDQRDQGWIRGSTSATVTISNVSAGGGMIPYPPGHPSAGAPGPFSYGDTMFHRIVLGASLYTPTTLAHTFGTLSENTVQPASTLTANKTFTGIVDKRFPASSASYTASCSIANSALTGQAAAVLTVTTDSDTVDPRLTVAHLMQMDASSFATPPLSTNDADDQRLSSQLAYLATNVRTARGTLVGNTITGGFNSISLDVLLESQVDTSIETFQNAAVTGTQGGEAGWTPFFTWSSSLPGGTWRKTVTIDTASTATLDNTYLIGATKDYVLVAVDPRVGIHAGVTAPGDTAGHLTAGEDIDVVAWVMNTATGHKEIPDAGSMQVGVIRYRPDLGYMERLASDTDPSSAAWEQWSADETLNYFTMTALAADSRVFRKQFTNTDGWGDLNIRFLFKGAISGTPYEGFLAIEMTGGFNGHDAADAPDAPDAPVFDAVAFATRGKVSFR